MLTSTLTQNSLFTGEEIRTRLERILKDPIFAHSDILKRFLQFIVSETLAGNSNCLKEYTIAVNVLHKPVHFNPQESSIVRIHAGRLRRALELYYNKKGLSDDFQIRIPLGQYVPVFLNPGLTSKKKQNDGYVPNPRKTVLLSVFPLHDGPNDPLASSLTERLGAQLTISLLHLNTFEVLTHYSMSRSAFRTSALQRVGSAVETQWMINAGIELCSDTLQIQMELFRKDSAKPIWSKGFAQKFEISGLYEAQCAIIDRAVAELEGLSL